MHQVQCQPPARRVLPLPELCRADGPVPVLPAPVTARQGEGKVKNIYTK